MKKKERVFTFKTDENLAEELARIPNKSEFIRHAIERALANKCPLCNGSGSLSPAQAKHLAEFLDGHSLKKCDECDAVHFTCGTKEQNSLH
jgi:hypothetical protein